MPDLPDAESSALVPVLPVEVLTARPVGRPTKRTPELTAELAEAIALGLTDDQAAAMVGIASSTLSEWLKIEEFSDAVKGAQARRIFLRLQRVERGEPGWQGAAWTLERLHPARFARPPALVQTNIVNTPVKIDPVELGKILEMV